MVIYTARVMAALRFPFPKERYNEDGDAIDYNEMMQAAHYNQEQYVEELLDDHGRQSEAWKHQMDAIGFEEDENRLPAYPDLLLDELDSISGQIQELEDYRNKLLIFARLFSLEPQAARKLADRVGMSYSTILRNASDEDVRDVQAIARQEASALVHDKDAAKAAITNAHDLEMHQRLRVLAGPAPTEEDPT
jgi:hypothetical protein